ncbi:hypothetical protein OAO01_03790 [Oligoflexia bacterium]|nr:hypothetical protein [Oligoflexia bacterium]
MAGNEGVAVKWGFQTMLFLRSISSVLFKFWLCLSVLVCLAGCSLLKERTASDSEADLQQISKQKLSPEESKELLGDVGGNWLYGQGLGNTALTIGTIALFPPYALYVLGNSALSLSGYKTVELSDALPEEGKANWGRFYDGVTSGPGRFTAALAGEEYRSKELAKQRLRKYIVPAKGQGPEATFYSPETKIN